MDPQYRLAKLLKDLGFKEAAQAAVDGEFWNERCLDAWEKFLRNGMYPRIKVY